MGRPRSYKPNDLIGFKNKNTQNSYYEVIKFVEFRKNKAYYKVKFDTGYVSEFRRDKILSGNIRNPDIHTNINLRINEEEFIGYKANNNAGEPFEVISFNDRTNGHLFYNVKFINTGSIKAFERGRIKRGQIRDPIYTEGFIGYKGINNQGESFEVISFGESVRKRRTYNVKFEHTGYIKSFNRRYILNGQIKDPYYPTIYGVGCCGNQRTQNADCTANLAEYEIWKSMLSRCYNKDNKNYNNYGAKGIKVCDRWLCYEYFCQDLPNILGYNMWKMYPNIYRLDKDTLQQDIEDCNKVYSPETCIFISARNNSLEMHKRKNINITGFSGVFEQKSGNYFVRVDGDYYGTFSDINAAANMYNHVVQYRNYPQEFMNNVPYMSRLECNEYRTQPNSGKKVMCRVLEKQKNKNSITDTCQLIQMCHIVDNTQPRN